MLRPRTLKVLVLLLLIYGLLWLFTAIYSDSPLGMLLAAPLLSIYAFHKIGVPGLLEHNGLCGWGWCAPTMLGWLVAAVFSLISLWLIAWTIASLSARLASR